LGGFFVFVFFVVATILILLFLIHLVVVIVVSEPRRRREGMRARHVQVERTPVVSLGLRRRDRVLVVLVFGGERIEIIA